MAPGRFLIGRGVYTIKEASILTRVPAQRIRRWTQGYNYRYRGKLFFSGPVIGSEVRHTEGSLAIEFADLIEIRFLDAFRSRGVKWSTIHIATKRARELTGRVRPFSTGIFQADGRTILPGFAPEFDDSTMQDLLNDELVWKAVIRDYLYDDLDFNKHMEASLWWPLGKGRVLYNGYQAEGSAALVSRWHEVAIEAVEDAIEFEEKLAA